MTTNISESTNNPYDGSISLVYKDGEKSLERVEEIYLSSGDEVIHTVLEGETIQSISFKYYGDSGLWYMITDVNNIYNPLSEILPGLQLMIPNS